MKRCVLVDPAGNLVELRDNSPQWLAVLVAKKLAAGWQYPPPPKPEPAKPAAK